MGISVRVLHRKKGGDNGELQKYNCFINCRHHLSLTFSIMDSIMSIKSNSYKKIWSDQEARKNYENNFDRIFMKSKITEVLKMLMPALNKVILAKQSQAIEDEINKILDENNVDAYCLLTGEGLKIIEPEKQNDKP